MKRHQYENAWPGKFGTDLMTVDGIKLHAVGEIGRNPVIKHQIQPECGE